MNLSKISSKAVAALFGDPNHIDFRVGRWEHHYGTQRIDGESRQVEF